MSDPKSAQVLLQLTTSMRDICKVTIETNYGLIVVVNSDKSLSVHNSITTKPGPAGPSSQLPEPGAKPDPQHKQSGYKYRVFPEYQTGFVWYDVDWPGNPKDEYMVDEDDLAERYGEAWNKAYEDWMDRHTAAFEKQEMHLCSQNHQPFPDVEERKAWVVEGLLLTCWLSLRLSRVWRMLSTALAATRMST
ncbi:hypothetical protein PG985_012890 [Apiospora marii]|uniref:uncharacterized protein n=1 Tax=Apiospora marii TaxID=335849 RepID=UPI00312EE856